MWTRRLRNISGAVTIPLVLFGPLVLAAWDLRRGGDEHPAPIGAGRDDELARAYLSARNPLIDRLLPEGRGGTVFSETIDASGTADFRAAAITLRASTLTDPSSDAVELHERAHLLFAFAGPEISRLMRGLPPPDPDEYAATNRGEHFAEMAATAWTIVEPPEGFCPLLPPHEALVDAEQRVPGTAGFVDRYLREPELLNIDGYADLARVARELTEDRRAEWTALWRVVDARRNPDGTFEPWRHTSVRQYVQSLRDEHRNTGGAFGTIQAWLLTPSLMLATIFD